MKTEVKMKWQNLCDGKCPACGAGLELVKPNAKIYACNGGASCPRDFHIREDKLLAIISDPNSLARRNYKGKREELEGFERHAL